MAVQIDTITERTGTLVGQLKTPPTGAGNTGRRLTTSNCRGVVMDANQSTQFTDDPIKLSGALARLDRPDHLPVVDGPDSLLAALVAASDREGRYYAEPPLLLALIARQDPWPSKLDIFKWRDELLTRGDITVAPLAQNCYGGIHLVLTIQNRRRFQRWSERQAIPASVRAAVYARDGHSCVTCGTDESLSLDHIYPWSKGGADTIENLQTMCRPCNSRKSDKVGAH